MSKADVKKPESLGKKAGSFSKVSADSCHTPKKRNLYEYCFVDHYPDENPDSAIDHITNALIKIGSFQRAQEKRIASAMKKN